MLRSLFVVVPAFALIACSEEAPPKPAPKPAAEAPAPITAPPPAPPPAPVAKAEPKPDPNKELADRVKRALTDDAKIQAAGIDVTASNGTVTLWGTAATQSERNRAGAAAAKVQGVNSVDNRLAIVKGS